MNAIIACPSFALRLESVPRGDVLIGVNRAVRGLRCDWWAASDYPMVRDTRAFVMGQPTLFTRADTARHFPDYPTVEWESIFGRWPPAEYRWTAYTMMAAIVLAAHLGADKIDIYGCAWQPGPDFDGTSTESDNRSEDRWVKERGYYCHLTSLLRGITVTRIP